MSRSYCQDLCQANAVGPTSIKTVFFSFWAQRRRCSINQQFSMKFVKIFRFLPFICTFCNIFRTLAYFMYMI